MPSSPILRARVRALLFISTSFALFAFVSLWTSWDHASAAPDKGAITPTASTITVNSTADVANSSDGLCTLREAITAANNNTASGVTTGECVAGSSSGSDIISLSVTGTINLSSALPSLSSSIIIAGPGANALVIQRSAAGGTPNFRVFAVNATITVSGVTIANGRSADGLPGAGFAPGYGGQGDNGGGVFNSGDLTLTDVVVTGNRTGDGGVGTTGSGGFGGYGGGVYNSGTLTLTNVTVSNNLTGNGATASDGGEGGKGGGVYASFTSGAVTLTNCTISNNSTGRGIDGYGGSLLGSDGGAGGGIYLEGGTVNIVGVVVSNNTTGSVNLSPGHSANGGGAAGVMNNSAKKVTLIGITIDGNHTGDGLGPQGHGGGGAGLVNAFGNLTLINSTISNNSTGSGATGAGPGGFSSSGSAVLINSTISGNTASNAGGGVYNAGNLALTNCTITNNSAGPGNGVFAFDAYPPVEVMNTIIAGNGGSFDVYGPFHSRGHNLIGKSDGSNNLTNGSNGDQVGTAGSPVNPQLGPLANNGGPTLTHALLTGSPALEGGDNCAAQAAHCGDANLPQLTTDERGTVFKRMVDGPDADTTSTVDIGAYETQGALADLPEASTSEDTQLLIPFDAGDTSTITSVTATSSSPLLVPNDSAHLSAALAGSTGIVTINPAANQNGTTNITVTVNRSGGGSASKTFLLTVNPVNDAPSFTKGGDPTVDEDAGAQTVTNWATGISAGPADESGQTLTFQVTNNTNAALFSSAPAISPTGTLTYTPAANANGSATITITLKDNGGTANGGVDTSAAQTFTITVNAVNDAPSFTRGADRTVNEDSGSQTVSPWATNLSTGAANESSQTLTFQVTSNSNPSLFSAAPSISPAGTLTYTPAANANGSATITIVLKDNGGTANGGVDTSAPQTFTITVNSVNDAPSFTKGANQIVNEDAGAQTVANWATGISAGPANESGQALTFQVTNNTNAVLFSSGPAISSTGTLTYTPAANANGSATLTINLKDDGGVANGGVDTSASQTFIITVNSVNDAPSFTKGSDQFVNNNTGAQTVDNWATNISAGPANESSQTVTFQVTNNTNAGVFSVAPAISSNGRLTYTPVANANGLATITIVLNDNGGTANGGVNTSPPQTFNITVNSTGGSVSFSSPTYGTTESSGSTTITVKRTGDLSRAVAVDYATSGDTGLPCSTPGAASPKCDFTSALGTLKFAAGEDTKTFTVLISQDSFVEGSEPFTLTLSNATGGAALATPATATVTIADDASEPLTNAIDDASNFVRQNYHDFLNREPDASGLAFWTNQITSCGSDQACIELRRINVSAAFFLSIEFQGTGYLVERLYKTSYGDVPGVSTFGGAHQLLVPIVRFNEFLPDTQEIGQGVIVGQPGWEMALENNKVAFVAAFVQRARFTTAFPTSRTPTEFVNQLNTNAGNVLSATELATAIGLFGSATDTSNLTARAQALRQVAEDADLNSAEFNCAFVLMEYFGYERRNPNDPQDTDYSGYDFWLTKLNQFNGNFVNADMVKAFITSSEYRQHFGP